MALEVAAKNTAPVTIAPKPSQALAERDVTAVVSAATKALPSPKDSALVESRNEAETRQCYFRRNGTKIWWKCSLVPSIRARFEFQKAGVLS
jgi:hypothetical protein